MFRYKVHFLSFCWQRAALLIFSLLVHGVTFAQVPRIVIFQKTDLAEKRRYIRDFVQWRTGRVFLATRNLGFELRSRSLRQSYIQFQPSSNLVMGLAGYYRRLGLEIGFKLPTSDSRSAKFGNSRIMDWSTTFYTNRLGADVFFQRYHGFYVRNGYEVDQKWRTGNPYPRYPDLTAFNLGGNVYYIFNHNRFSYRAAFTQMEEQVRSAGSFLLMATGTITNFANNAQPFIPVHRLPGYNNNDFRYGRFYNLALAPGYGYTFVRDRLYASVSLFMGVGIQDQRYTLDDEVHTTSRIFRKNNLRLAGGYFGETFYAGTGLLLDNNLSRVQDLMISTNNKSFRVFAGMRF